MTDQDVTKYDLMLRRVAFIAQEVAPKRTGNLAYNSIKVRHVRRGTWQIYIDEEVAPYAFATIEKWISPKWRGKKNPNEGWWDDAVEQMITQIQAILKAERR